MVSIFVSWSWTPPDTSLWSLAGVHGGSHAPAGPHLECPILSWVTDLPDSGGSETNFEFDFDKNLVTDARAVI